MVKGLGDMCLWFLQQHLDSMGDLARSLPTLYKERLIERLAYHDMLQGAYLPHVSRSLLCAALRHIKLYQCHQVDDRFLAMLAASRCQLEVLVINGCPAITDKGVKEITAGQEKLCVLQLKKLPLLTSAGLTAIRSPALWKLVIKSCSLLTCEGITTVARQCQGLKVVHTENCVKLDRQTFSNVAAALGPSLEELDLGIPSVTDQELFHLAQFCPNLKKLDLTGAKAVGREALIKLFQGCTLLQSLDLSYCSRVAEVGECVVLWTLPQTLRQLSLCGVMLADQQVLVEAMQRLPLLTSLRLCGMAALNDYTLGQILECVGGNLETLDISGRSTSTFTDDGLRAVAKHCTQLTELRMSLLKEVTGITLAPIFQDQDRANRFTKLYFSFKQLDISILSLVSASCHELTLLEISGITDVTDDLLFQLAEHCPKLTHLGIKGCRQITDSGLCALVQQCPMKSLVLSGIYNLTDKSIFTLANSRPELEEIYLNGCAQITPAAVRYLCDCCILRLSVRHAIPNAVPNQVMAKNLDTGEFCRADLLPVNTHSLHSHS